MASTKEKMQKAQQLIKEKRYDEARAILRTIDHDTAYEWLDKLDEIDPVKQDKTPTIATKPTNITSQPKDKSRIKSKTVTVSSKALFGKTQMDKALEKYQNEGLKLVSQSPSDKKNKQILRFEYEMSDEEVAAENRRNRNYSIGCLGFVLIMCSLSYFTNQQEQRRESVAATQNAIQQATSVAINQVTADAQSTNDADATATNVVINQVTDDAQSTNDVEATATATFWTLTPSPTSSMTPTATDTSTNTPTPLPTLPSQTFRKTEINFHIDSIMVMDETADTRLTNDRVFILLGEIENTTNQFECVLSRDIRLILNDVEYAPQASLMDEFADNLGRDYIGAFSGHCLEANERELTFVAFDVPNNAQSVALRFGEDTQTIDMPWELSVYPAQETLSFADLVPMATQQSITVATQSAAATMTATLWTQTSTPTITPTPRPTNTRLPSSTPRPTNTQSPEERNEEDANLIELGLDFAGGLDIARVQITDGRAAGGERGVLISYRSSASTQEELAGEWGTMFGVVGGAVREFDIDLDAMTIIVGDTADNAIAIVTAQMTDVIAFINGNLTSLQFFQRLSIQDL
jgi:hypothetical protein